MRNASLICSCLVATVFACGPVSPEQGPKSPLVSTPSLDGGVESCAANQILCGGGCTDVSSHHEHCGQCDSACAEAESCKEGRCGGLPSDCRKEACGGGFYCDLNDGHCKRGCAADSDCPQPGSCDISRHSCSCAAATHLCGGSCMSNKSPLACGQSCTACPGLPSGFATCDGQSCGVACNPGFIMCNGSCIACGDPHGTASCEAGACKMTCQPGFHLCGTACYPDDDPSHCGAACGACASPSQPGMQAACVQQACSAQCAPGFTMCHGACRPSATCAAWSRTTLATDNLPSARYVNARYAASGALQLAGAWFSYRDDMYFKDYYSVRYLEYAGGAVTVNEQLPMSCVNVAPENFRVAPGPMVGCRGSTTSGPLIQERSGTTWGYRSVAIPGMGYATPVQLELDGQSVAWTHSSPYGISFGTRNADTTWSAAQVDSFGNTVISWFSWLGGAPGQASFAYAMPNQNDVLATQSGQSLQKRTLSRKGTTSDRYLPLPDGTLLEISSGTTPERLISRSESDGWAKTTITSEELTDWDALVTPDGLPHVAWVGGNHVSIATRLGRTWVTENVAGLVKCPQLSLLASPSGRAVVFCKDDSGVNLYE